MEDEEVLSIRQDFQELVSDEIVDKGLALRILHLHQRWEVVLSAFREKYSRETDRLNASLDKFNLQLEIDKMTRERQVKEHEILQLRPVNEQLELLKNRKR